MQGLKRERRVQPSDLDALQSNQSKVRNICVLAHVDHGKTSLTDCLLVSNGLISPRLAGQLRFLDSREDEQKRGITMKASAISLIFNHRPIRLKNLLIGSEENSDFVDPSSEYLINLVDSPGHVDFVSDVVSAIRLCDGGLIVVDVIEGVCTQTTEVMKRAVAEKLSLCLVLNKIDRLITERHFDAVEAYEHLLRVVEQVNGVLSSFLKRDDSFDDHLFYPEKGNVVFCSAFDNWAFRLVDFMPFVYKNLSQGRDPESLPPPKVVLKALWGPYVWNAKKGKISQVKDVSATESLHSTISQKTGLPLFSQFVFQAILEIYTCCLSDFKPKRLIKILKLIGIDHLVREADIMKVANNAKKQNENSQVSSKRSLLQRILSVWLPFSKAVLSMVVKAVPDPIEAQEKRLPVLVPDMVSLKERVPELSLGLENVRNSIRSCDNNEDSPLVVFIAKMIAVERKTLSNDSLQRILNFEGNLNEDDLDEKTEFLFAFGRVFSGNISGDKELSVLGPKYIPDGEHNQHKFVDKVKTLPFRLMGPDLIPVDTMAAGNLIALYGLAPYLVKSATLSDQDACFSLSQPAHAVSPLLRVAVHPKDSEDWSKLVEGLKLLNRADPVVEVMLESNGEYVIGAIGELHLETCLKDLTERFAKVQVAVSEPIVSFKETLTLVSEKTSIDYNSFSFAGETLHELVTSQEKPKEFPSNFFFTASCEDGGDLEATFRAVPLPLALIRYIESIQNKHDHEQSHGLIHLLKDFLAGDVGTDDNLLSNFKQSDSVGNIISSGPDQFGPNLLLCSEETKNNLPLPIFSDLITGFQLACRRGPVCDEPFWGCCIIVDAIDTKGDWGNASGQLISTFKEAIRSSVFLHQDKATNTNCEIRIVEAIFSCELICTVDLQQGDSLGKLYGVLSRRRGKILSEDLVDGTCNIFTIKASLPVAESFGFADEVRITTSGCVSTPQMVFDRWDILDENPFYKPTTQEELEEFGEMDFDQLLKENVARRMVHKIRKRKGLEVEEKIVAFGEKQRTLSRKK